VSGGGLGFGYKWNMGWMNDTLEYMKKDPVHRKHHHHQMTFGLTYAFTENFVLPISHDEVVHGKGSMLGKMPGGAEERFANLRAYYGVHVGAPGKEAVVHGPGVRARSASGTTMPSLTGPRWTIRAMPGAASGAGPQHAVPRGTRAACLRHRPGRVPVDRGRRRGQFGLFLDPAGRAGGSERGGAVQLHARRAAGIQGGPARRRPSGARR
jgi:hypothetical protein